MRLSRFCLLVFMFAALRSSVACADVVSSANPALVGQEVHLTVQLNPPPDVNVTPTGTVTFVDGGVIIGTVPLQDGIASVTTEFSTPGDHSIVAQYSGDQNFQPANSPPFIERITAEDVFTIAVSPSILAQHPGGASTVRVTLFGTGSTAPPVHLSCENLPPGTTCSFQSSMVQPTVSGSGTLMKITSTATRTSNNVVRSRSAYNATILFPFLLGSIVVTSVAQWKKKVLFWAGLFVLGTMTLCLAGCGDTLKVVHGGTPAGSYSVRIVGNDGTLTQTATVQLQLK